VVTAQPVVREQVIVEQPVPVNSSRRVVGVTRFDPAAVLAVVLAIALGVIGAVALARAGLESPIDEPVVQVAGFTHTAVLGLIEIGMALIMLWAGLSRDRGAILFVSILFGAASLVAAIEPSVGGDALSIEQGWAILLVIAFGLVALVAAIAPTVWRRTDRVEPI
jgi:hypothetical protein